MMCTYSDSCHARILDILIHFALAVSALLKESEKSFLY